MKKFNAFFLLLVFQISFSQFISPGNGTTFTLSSLATVAPTAVQTTTTGYTMASNVTISAGDTFIMDQNTTLLINSNIQFTVGGIYQTTATSVIIKGADATNFFKGILFDTTSTVDIKNTTFEYGGGIRVSTGNFVMDNCIVRYFKSGLVTSSAMSFSVGSPIVKNSQFIDNDYPAFASGTNQAVAFSSLNNYLSGNSKTNGNRPQINMGPSGPGVTKIINNTIIGDPNLTMVGGVSISALLGGENNVQIENNTIRNNRYGITVAGNTSTGVINGNIIENNNINPNVNTGGSGISLSGAGSAVMGISIRNNQIRGNLWGITLLGTSRANLGDDTQAGNNIFYSNSNNGNTYALYNNTPNPISAKGNCWRENEQSTVAMVEAVIGHQVDDPSLGWVTFEPFGCTSLATTDILKSELKIYPNPNNGIFFVESIKGGSFVVSDISGRFILSGILSKGKNEINLEKQKGIYILQMNDGSEKLSKKIIVQ